MFWLQDRAASKSMQHDTQRDPVRKRVCRAAQAALLDQKRDASIGERSEPCLCLS